MLKVASLLSLLFLASCGCNLHPMAECWGLKCEAPGAKGYRSNEDIAALLRDQVNKPLGTLAKVSGRLTTSIGKNIGILGWRDLHSHALVDGVVLHAAYSSDHFYTVDMRIRSMLLDGQPLKLQGTRYIRAEICMNCITLKREAWPQPGERVKIAGKLKWDADGFLEVHPQKGADVSVLTSLDE